MAVHPIGNPWADYVRVHRTQNDKTYPDHHILGIKNHQALEDMLWREACT